MMIWIYDGYVACGNVNSFLEGLQVEPALAPAQT